jgi:hypothetical protein
MTDYNFSAARVEVTESEAAAEIRITSPDAPAHVVLDRRAVPSLPADSAFASIDEASAFLKYKPHGLSVTRDRRVNVVRIVRDESAWSSLPRVALHQEWGFFKDRDVQPEMAFEVMPIEYQWMRGELVSAA